VNPLTARRENAVYFARLYAGTTQDHLVNRHGIRDYEVHRIVVERQLRIGANKKVMPLERQFLEIFARQTSAPSRGQCGGALLVDDARNFPFPAEVNGCERATSRHDTPTPKPSRRESNGRATASLYFIL
jgi:hypothetical protein